MSYNQGTYIRTYLSTDKFIVIQDSFNTKVFTLNVCKYQKSLVKGQILVIFYEESDTVKKYLLDFLTIDNASVAETNLRNAINSLKVNCLPVINPTNAVTTPIPITLLQYKTLRTGNTLVPLQYYDVTDTNNDLGLGTIAYRVLAKTNNDSYPEGVIISQNENQVIIDVINNRFSLRKNLIRNIYLSGISSLIEPSFNNTNIDFFNSSGTFTNCQNIYSFNSGSNSIINSSKISLKNVNSLTATTLLNCNIKDLQSINLSTLYPLGLSNVNIDLNDSIGKTGNATNNLTTVSNQITISSYENVINQEIIFDNAAVAYTIFLKNLLPNCNSTFKIKISVLTNNPTTRFSFVDLSTGNTFFTGNLNSIENKIFICKWNKSILSYELVDIEDKKPRIEKRETFTATLGQTIFILNNQVRETTINPETNRNFIEMFIFGQKQTFGLDYTFSSPNIVTYQNRGFTLAAGDEIEFLIN